MELLVVIGSVWDPVLREIELPVDVVNVFDSPALVAAVPLVSPVASPEEMLVVADILVAVAEADRVVVNDDDPVAGEGDWPPEPDSDETKSWLAGVCANSSIGQNT